MSTTPRGPFGLVCLLCGAEVGFLVRGKLVPPPGGIWPLPRRGGLLRCGHCGGSLYLELLDRHAAALEWPEAGLAPLEAAG
jgi:hypothetical protein